MLYAVRVLIGCWLVLLESDAVTNLGLQVWAFAITIIEVWMNAVTPYKGWMNAFVMEQVLDGYIHPCPEECPANFYELAIRPSLQFKPKDRPCFKQLTSRLAEYFDTDWLNDPMGPDAIPTVVADYTDGAGSQRHKETPLPKMPARASSAVSLKGDEKPLDDETLTVIAKERDVNQLRHRI